MRAQGRSWRDARPAFLWVIVAAATGACSEGTAPDVTPPTVTGALPADGSLAVATAITVSATFSEAMDPASLNTSTVTLKRTSTGGAVAGTVSYAAATRTVFFAPAAPLLNTTGYTFAITTGAKDAAGNALAAQYAAAFTTVQFVGGAPYFQGTDPGDRVHFHIRLTQSGQALGVPTDCQPLPLADCEIFALNPAGVDVVGPANPNQNGGSFIISIVGTFTDPTITFTFTIANGRTFTYSGTVTGSNKMTGTMSGATLPATPMILDR